MADSVAAAAPAAPAAGTPAPQTPPAAPGGENGGVKPGNEGKTPEPGQKPGETPAQAAKRMLKAVIDGKEVEVDEAEAIKAYQKNKAADKRFMEAANIKKQAEQFMAQLKRATKDPKALAEMIKHPSLGGDFKALAEQYLYELIKEEQLSPAEREHKQLKEELARREEADRVRQEAEQAAQAKQLEDKYTKEYQKDIITALETSGLPKTEYTVARMARYMHMGLERGVELKAADVVQFVWQDYQRDLGAFRALPTEKLLDMFGPEIADKIRKYDLEKVRNGGAGGGKPPTPPPASGSGTGGGKKPLTTAEFRELAKRRAEQ